jgi:predicted metal-dependent phosphoesterase TrpH
MSAARWIAACLLLVSLAAGTFSDSTPVRPRVILGGYHVLAADFHVHSFPLSWATLAPWDIVTEAQRQHLDVIAIVGHNYVWASKVGRWFSHWWGGPLVITGEEIVSSRYHLLAIGIHSTIDWKQTAESAIEQVHRQGGVAIAAHPVASYWPAYGVKAMQALDGAEILHPIAYENDDFAAQLQQFYGRTRLTAMGDSDFHGLGPVGLCRTYIFVEAETEQGVLDAIRHGRTVVYDRAGRAYGDPVLTRLAGGSLPETGLGAPTAAGVSHMVKSNRRHHRFDGCGDLGLVTTGRA